MKFPSLIVAVASTTLLALPETISAQQSPFAASTAENPFAAVQKDRYSGTFASEDVSLELELAGSDYSGELFYSATSQTYPVTAKLTDRGIEGHFTAGGKQFPYSFTLNPDGESGLFVTDGYRGTLRSMRNILTGSSIDGQAGELLDEAIAIRDTLEPADAAAVTSSIALAMAQGGEWDRARTLVEEVPDSTPNRKWVVKSILDEIARNKAKAGDYAGVRAIIEELPLDGYVRESAVDEFARIYTEAGNVEQARALIDTIPPHHDRRPMISQTMIQTLADAGDVAGARSLVGNIKADDFSLGHYFNLANYDIATAEIRNGNQQAGLSTLKGLIAQTQPDPDFAKILGPGSYMNGIIHALKKLYAEGRHTNVLALSADFERSVKALPSHVHKIEASHKIEGYAAIASAQLATGDVKGAKKSVSKARSTLKQVAKPLKGFAQRPIARVDALMGNTDDAMRFIAKSEGLLTRMVAYGDLAQAQAGVDNLAAASQTLMIAHSDLVRSKTFSRGGSFNWGGLMKSAFSMGSFVGGGKISAGSVAKLGGALMKGNQPGAPVSYSPEQEAHAKKVIGAYNHYAHILGSLDNLPDHDLLINTIPEAEVRSQIYWRMALRQLTNGESERAQKTAAGITDPDLKAGFLFELTATQAESSSLDEALEIVRKSASNPAEKAVMLSRIAGSILKKRQQV